MERCSNWLLEHRNNVYSQYGEDGVIAKILDVLPETDKWCVEFGAWDGRHLSNTCNLIENRGYSAVLIEGNEQRAEQLAKQHADEGHIQTVGRFVGFQSNDNLDTILRETSIPVDFDLLSIDIDGNDYHAWKATSEYSPKVVCIEFNPTIPTEVSFVQPADPNVFHGCGLKSVVELGREKGYELVCVTHCNAIFVRAEYLPLFKISDNSPHTLRTDLSAVTYLFSGFDGRILLKGSGRLPWHNIAISESAIQRVPALFRSYPGNLGRVSRTIFKIYKRLSKTRTKRAA